MLWECPISSEPDCMDRVVNAVQSVLRCVRLESLRETNCSMLFILGCDVQSPNDSSSFLFLYLFLFFLAFLPSFLRMWPLVSMQEMVFFFDANQTFLLCFRL